MPDIRINTDEEKALAKWAAKRLKDELMTFYPSFRNRKSAIKGFRDRKAFVSRVGYNFKQGFLDRVVIYASKYSFHVNYGYDLIPKSEWQKRRRSRKVNPTPPAQRDVPGTEHFQKVLESGILDELADKISQLRFVQVGNLFKEIVK